MDIESSIFVAGHQGMVGSNLLHQLTISGYKNIVTRDRSALDLTNQKAVYNFFKNNNQIDYVFLAAAKVGEIRANATLGDDFIRENLFIQTNVIDASYKSGLKKLLFLGSSCIYPKFAKQPIQESSLLKGDLEPTNEPYAIAKIAGIKMCQAYCRQYGFNAISVLPCNLYGIGDNFNLESSHVLAALLRRFHEAKVKKIPQVVVWGNGNPEREFLYSEDAAQGCIFLMKNYESSDCINLGVGSCIKIKELVGIIKEIVGYSGEIIYDSTQPEGTPKKVMSIDRLHRLGWQAKIPLKIGISKTYHWYVNNLKNVRK